MSTRCLCQTPTAYDNSSGLRASLTCQRTLAHRPVGQQTCASIPSLSKTAGGVTPCVSLNLLRMLHFRSWWTPSRCRRGHCAAPPLESAKIGSDIHVMLALRRRSRQVVVAKKQLDSTNVIGEFLGKRQRGAPPGEKRAGAACC